MAGFWIDQAEVINAQYRRCVEGGVCSEPLTCTKGEPTYADPENDSKTDILSRYLPRAAGGNKQRAADGEHPRL